MDTSVIHSPERHLWTLVEPIHAITYFAPESQQAFEDADLPGFWRGYFGGRAAPLGAVDSGAVTALLCRKVYAEDVGSHAREHLSQRARLESPELCPQSNSSGSSEAPL